MLKVKGKFQNLSSRRKAGNFAPEKVVEIPDSKLEIEFGSWLAEQREV